MRALRGVTLLCTSVAMLLWATGVGATGDELAKRASWKLPDSEEVQQLLVAWLEKNEIPQTEAEKIWAPKTGMDHLERIAATIVLVEPRAEPLLQACRKGATPDTHKQWLAEEQIDPLVSTNLRLLLGRSLAQGNYVDEALQQLDGLKPSDVLDPASLLFYQSIVYHRLVQREKGLEAIDQLLENEDKLPQRYSTLARLMQTDLMQLKDGSLDDVSRHMKDVQRRLELGRSGSKVREVEDEVIEMLDKLIKEEEDKQSKANQAMAGASRSPSNPADQSMIPGGKINAPGKVHKRSIGDSAGWGELPPKEREAALQEISREFPAHYREVVEEYFRELAKQQK